MKNHLIGRAIVGISIAALVIQLAMFISEVKPHSLADVAEFIKGARGLVSLAGIAIGAAFMGTRELAFVLRLYLGIIFIYSSAENLLNPQPFATAVDNYKILPRPLINSFAITLTWVEFATGCFLITGLFAPSAGLLSTVLYLAFFVAISSAVMRGLDINCGCFNLNHAAKAGEDKVSWAHASIRLTGVALSVLILRFSHPTDWPAAWLIKLKS